MFREDLRLVAGPDLDPAALAPAASLDDLALDAYSRVVTAAVETVAPAVVRVHPRLKGRGGVGQGGVGSGVIVSPDGTVTDLLMIRGTPDIVAFWGTLKFAVEKKISEIEERDRQANYFGRR